MSKLAFILTDLIKHAERNRPPCPVSTTLRSGLKVAAYKTAQGHPCLSLTRTATQKPSQKEAETCADHLGWANPRIVSSTTRSGLHCLLVWPPTLTEVLGDVVLEAVADNLALTAALNPVCGTCDHWTPTTPSMGECQLGWVAHDNLRDSKGKPTAAGHGAARLPEMQTGCKCAATVAGQPGYAARRRAL